VTKTTVIMTSNNAALYVITEVTRLTQLFRRWIIFEINASYKKNYTESLEVETFFIILSANDGQSL